MFHNKNENFKKFIFFIFITILSAIYIYFFLYFERRIIGISPQYHPDSVYYFESFSNYKSLTFKQSLFNNIKHFFDHFFSNTFYLSIINLIYELHAQVTSIKSLSFFHNTFYRYVISFNIFFHLILNLLILNYYFKQLKSSAFDHKNLLFLLIILFLPFRCHLTVNILKDSLILFTLVIFLTYQNIYSLIISFVLVTPFRFGAIIYYILFLDYRKFDKKMFISLSVLILIFLLVLFFRNIYNDYGYTHQDLLISIKEFLKARNIAELGGRQFDEVPSFYEYKTGSLIRSVTWPVLFLTGSFALFTKSYLFYYLAFEILIIQIIFFYFFRRTLITINLVIVLMLIGIYTNTFTSYFRYSYIAFYISSLICFFNIKHKL